MQEEDTLAEEVRKYPCLYDKSEEGGTKIEQRIETHGVRWIKLLELKKVIIPSIVPKTLRELPNFFKFCSYIFPII